VLIDAKNYGHVKLLPILIRYVHIDLDADKTENDSCVQIKTKLVDFVEITGETAEILFQSALQAIRKLDLENKMIAISGDNTNTNKMMAISGDNTNTNKMMAISGDNTNINFGRPERKGTNNVFCKIKEDLNKCVIGLGCVVHMIHNCAHSSFYTVPVDTECLVVKTFGYFNILTVRVERLKEFCDFVGQQYKDILGYINIRWR
jgi:uncharacterized protein YuzB (UPF0349 family)